ncbi:MAG: hypothetical protein JJE47_09900 [Acidimicrobiia bacterium]|nr:hypothetical protein [Acidimicrobiia bacterium]
MQAHQGSQIAATIDINHLRVGGIYEATTQSGRTATGEYLGIEVAHDDWMIILRNRAGAESIPVKVLTSVYGAAGAAA